MKPNVWHPLFIIGLIANRQAGGGRAVGAIQPWPCRRYSNCGSQTGGPTPPNRLTATRTPAPARSHVNSTFSSHERARARRQEQLRPNHLNMPASHTKRTSTGSIGGLLRALAIVYSYGINRSVNEDADDRRPTTTDVDDKNTVWCYRGQPVRALKMLNISSQ